MSVLQLRNRVIQVFPPVPSTTPVYLGTQTTTTNEDTTTWTGVDIGAPHPRRIIVLATYHGVAAAVTGTVNGYAEVHRNQNTAHEFGILIFKVPRGTSATITLTAASSIRKAVGVYAVYPSNQIRLDNKTGTANTATNATASNIICAGDGCIIYAGGQHGTVGDFTVTSNGTDAVVEDVDAQLEAAASYTFGHVNMTRNQVVTLTLAESVSGTKRIAATAFGASPPQ